MITIPIKDIEKKFNKKVTKYTSSLGLDIASRTGWSRIISDNKDIKIDYGFIDINATDKYFKYDRYIEIFNNLLYAQKIIIEESFYSLNVHTFQLLSRLGAFAYCIAKKNEIKEVSFLLATSARKYLGFKGNLNKKIIQEQFLKLLKLDLDDNDIIDAIILAMTGILE